MPTVQEVKFKRKTTTEIDDLEIEDGALIYNVDNGKTYMDYGNERIQTGGNADTMIYVGDEEPTDEDIKLWIETPISETKASEIVNEYTESDKVGYSTEYANNNFQTKGTILWTNSDPTSTFAAQDITLSSDDYDLLAIYFITNINSSANVLDFAQTLKGYGTRLTSSAPDGRTQTRTITRNSDISFSVSDGSLINASSVENQRNVPLYIVGYKTGLFE